MATSIDSSSPSAGLTNRENGGSKSGGRRKRDKMSGLAEMAREPSFWHGSAPGDVTGDASWKVWSRHLRRRGKPQPLEQLCKATSSPLSWGLASTALVPDQAKAKP